MTRPRWRWIRSGPSGPAMNMALDEALLRSPDLRPTLRTYRWDPWSLSLGYFQVADPTVVRRLVGPDLGVVRRPTGGRAIFHGDELTYAVVCPADEAAVPRNAVGAYRVLHGAVARALADLGVEADLRGERRLLSDTSDPAELLCFYRSTAFDLVAGDRKIVGSAQRRSGRAFLQHGSIPAGPNELSPEAAYVGATPEKIEARLGIALAEELGVELEEGVPTAEELALARRLEADRYGREGWTWRRGRREPGTPS